MTGREIGKVGSHEQVFEEIRTEYYGETHYAPLSGEEWGGSLHDYTIWRCEVCGLSARMDNRQRFLKAPCQKSDKGGVMSDRVISETLALKILGDGKVITAQQASSAWNVELPKDVPMRFTEADFQNTARDNASGNADWRLVRVLGLWSLRELRARFGVDLKRQPCFTNNRWWLESTEDKWAKRKPMPGYYLLDFAGKWGATSWDVQEARVKASGPDFERADEAALTEAVFTIFQFTGERLFKTWSHWGPTLNSFGYRVCVGYNGLDGWSVGGSPPSYDDRDFLRVVRSRKFSR